MSEDRSIELDAYEAANLASALQAAIEVDGDHPLSTLNSGDWIWQVLYKAQEWLNRNGPGIFSSANRTPEEYKQDAVHRHETALKQQLATAQNEIDTATDQIPPDLEGDSLSVALIKLCDERKTLREQLAAMEREREREKEVLQQLRETEHRSSQQLIKQYNEQYEKAKDIQQQLATAQQERDECKLLVMRLDRALKKACVEIAEFREQLQTAREQQERMREALGTVLKHLNTCLDDRDIDPDGPIGELYGTMHEWEDLVAQATPSGDAFDARAAVVELAEMVEASDRLRRLPLAGDVQRAVELKRKAKG